MIEDIEKVSYSEEVIRSRVQAMGQAISRDYAEKFPLIIGVLKGSFIFMADLLRAIDIPCETEFIAASSYGAGTVTSGVVKLTKDLTVDIRDRHVIIVEDILDSGVTLSFLREYMLDKEPASFKICTFLDKRERRSAPIEADYVGFECPDEFYVGYGLDFAEKYRNLPYIGVLKPEVYS